MSKILKVLYYSKPESSFYTFVILTENLNPKTEVIIFKISYDFFYPTRLGPNLYGIKVNQSKLSLNSGTGLTNLRVRLFSYAFLEDRNYYVCTGSINLYNSSGPNNAPLKTSILAKASDSGHPWIKNLRVTSVYGPYQNGQIVKSIDLNKPVRYIAYIGGKKYSRAQFLAIKWSYSIDGGEKQRFKHQKEWNYEKIVNNVIVYDDHAVMECNMLKSWNGKNINIYAFFRGESERVKVSAKGSLSTSTVKRKPNSGKNAQLIWGNKVSDKFEQKVIQICNELWGASRKMEMANGLMALMNVETWGTFKAQQLEGEVNSRNPKNMTISSFHKNGNTKSSKAVGLIQFTQTALESMKEFPKSTPQNKGSQERYDQLNTLKLKYAQMGEIDQLDMVKKYLLPAKSRIKTPPDIYLQVFAPIGVGKPDSTILYKKGTDKYLANKSVDTNKNDPNNKGIERSELLKRYWDSYNKGLKNKDGSSSSTETVPIPIEEDEQVSNGKWRYPIDNPMLCLYSQGGHRKPWHGSFGKKIRDGVRGHTGNDLLAVPGTKVYACFKGEIHRIYTSSSMAGHVVVVKVLDTKTFKSLKRKNYVPKYKNKSEILSQSFNEDGIIYLTFWHLSKNDFFKKGQEVKHDDVIGLTGVSGWNGKHFETHNPHLHFEVSNVGSAAGFNGKCNPSVYFNFKTEDELSTLETAYQDKINETVWK